MRTIKSLRGKKGQGEKYFDFSLQNSLIFTLEKPEVLIFNYLLKYFDSLYLALEKPVQLYFLSEFIEAFEKIMEIGCEKYFIDSQVK